MSDKVKLIPLNSEKDLQEALSWSYEAHVFSQKAKKANPVMTLAQFQKRRKANRLARKNRKRN